jgi:hypothetical protein
MLTDTLFFLNEIFFALFDSHLDGSESTTTPIPLRKKSSFTFF